MLKLIVSKIFFSGGAISTVKFTEGQAYKLTSLPVLNPIPLLNRVVICNSIADDTLKCESTQDQEKVTAIYKFTNDGTKLTLETSIPGIDKSYTEFFHLL